MKIQRYITTGILASAALMLAGSAQLQATPNLVVAAFATGTQYENSGGNESAYQTIAPGLGGDGTGGQNPGDCLEGTYPANGTIWWDGITYDAADGSTGSAYLNAIFNYNNWPAGNYNWPLLESIAPGYNNWYYAGPNNPGTAWNATGTVDGTQYHAVQFDIKWDTTSLLSIDQFNSGSNWNTSWFLYGISDPNEMADNGYSQGVSIYAFTGSGGNWTFLTNFNIPDSAATGWQTVTVNYSDTLPITTVAGLVFGKEINAPWPLPMQPVATPINGGFWLDNVMLLGNATPPPAVKMSRPVPATPGLAIFNATEGNSFYDRNQIEATQTSGLSWVNNFPASYSFTMTGFPANDYYGCEAYMFLIPDASANANGEDWNQAASILLEVQSFANGGQASVSYKMNEPNGETMTNIPFATITGPSAPTTVPQNSIQSSNMLFGTYTLTFTANDAGTLTVPDGTVGTFSLPAGTFDTAFTEYPVGSTAEPVPAGDPLQTNNYPFLIVLGGQANNGGAINQAVVYSSVAVTGPSGNISSVSENFLADANLATPALANWSTSSTHYAPGIVFVPSSALYWVDWSLPATGFSLEGSPSLINPTWKSVSTYSPIGMYGDVMQLIGPSDLQAPTKSQYWAAVSNSYSGLVVVLPGQTFAPGTALGYTGTPTEVTGEYVNMAPETVTVYAVDSNNNKFTGTTDSIALSSTDGASTLPNSVAMVNGTVTFSVANSDPFYFGADGTFTITATDATTSFTGTSAPVVVNN